MVDAVEVESVAAEYAWLAAHPCECGGGWLLTMQSAFEEAGGVIRDRLAVQCRECAATHEFSFRLTPT